MKRSEWSDNELEDLLRQMPKIKDHRNPRDIYQNLSVKKRNQKQWFYPSVAAAAAVLLLFILVPNLLGSPHSANDSASQEKSSLSKDTSEDSNTGIALQDSKETSDKNSFSGVQLAKVSSVKTAVYNEDVRDGKVQVYWIPDLQGLVLIPISIITETDSQTSWFNQYIENMAKLKESEWGLTDFYPLDAKLSLEEKTNTVVVDVPSNHPYAQGATNETSFVTVLEKDIASNSDIQKLRFKTNGRPKIELGNRGPVEEESIPNNNQHAYLFYYPNNGDLPYLVPSTETYQGINGALEAMKVDSPINGLKASLSNSLQVVGVRVEGNVLTVSLRDSLVDDQDALLSFESILLTAKNFGFEKVALKDSPIKTLGPFDLTKEIDVPVAPNLRTIN